MLSQKKMKVLVIQSNSAIPWTVGRQAPLSMEFSKQEYCSGLPFPFPGDLSDLRIELWSPALQVDSLPFEPLRKPFGLKKMGDYLELFLNRGAWKL